MMYKAESRSAISKRWVKLPFVFLIMLLMGFGVLTCTQVGPRSGGTDLIATTNLHGISKEGVDVDIIKVEGSAPGEITIAYTVASGEAFIDEIRLPVLVTPSEIVLASAIPVNSRQVDTSGVSPNELVRSVVFRGVAPGTHLLRFGPYRVMRPGDTYVVIPIAELRNKERILSRSQRPAVRVSLPFSVNGGVYAVTEIELEPNRTGVLVTPQDATAEKRTPAMAGGIELVDDLGNDYPIFFGADGTTPTENGFVVDYQYFAFEGELDPNATTLTLLLGNPGEIVEGLWEFPLSVQASEK